MEGMVITAAAACLCGLLIMLVRRTGAAKKLLLGGLGGLAAYGVVNLTGLITGIFLAPSFWCLGAAVLMGLPGVVAMLFIRLIFAA